jgi:hypothetical protein
MSAKTKQQYFVVLDQINDIWGTGTTKAKARKDAFYWHSQTGPAVLPFKKAMPCSQAVAGAGSDDRICIVNGIVHLEEEVEQNEAECAYATVQTGTISFEQFKERSIPEKLNILFLMLQDKQS